MRRWESGDSLWLVDEKSINLNADDRFVPTHILRAAYLRYEDSRNPQARPFVAFPERGYELGIVKSQVPELARGVSSLLSCSLEDAKNSRGGHLPDRVVERVQREIISPDGVANLWGTFGHRFVLSQQVDDTTSELLATILVARRKGTVFFFTGRYNNIRHSTITSRIDFEQPVADDPSKRWFDLFAFPAPERFKPRAYHHIANFVVAKQHRGQGLSRFLLDAILHKYARDYIEQQGLPIEHAQYLLCGRGFWQIGDPPWLTRMQRLGFYLRWGAESFFLEPDWAPLPPIYRDGVAISNLEYNRSFGLPEMYQQQSRVREQLAKPQAADIHIFERLPEVVTLAQNPRAKLQYFQTMFDFV